MKRNDNKHLGGPASTCKSNLCLSVCDDLDGRGVLHPLRQQGCAGGVGGVHWEDRKHEGAGGPSASAYCDGSSSLTARGEGQRWRSRRRRLRS